MKLTEKQKRFADFYIETGNATDSYRRAYNCTEKTASVEGFKNLAKPSVKSYIDSKLTEMSNKRIMDAEEVMTLLTSIARGEENEDVVVFGENGPEITTKGMSAKDRIKALELLGKRYTLWTDRKEIEGNIGVTIVDDLDD
ncbi:terminase small subunit [Metabacillus sp. Hm71]|uniref:terminase small subunit n=1 Tax=Metabacillus sp. Hm71 TaxID=3450743 RepID=UPI003F42F2F9